MLNKAIFRAAFAVLVIAGNTAVRGDGERASRYVKIEPANVDKLVEVLTSPSANADDRATAALGLAGEGARARDALPALAFALGDHHSRVRYAAALAIGYVACRGSGWVSRIEPLIADKDPWVRAAACRTAWVLGGSRRAVQQAIGLLAEGDTEVRVFAMDVVAQMGPVASGAVPTLCDQLGDPDVTISWHAGMALCEMGSASIAPLLRLRDSASAHLRALVVACLTNLKIPDPRVVTAIITGLDDRAFEVRLAAVDAVRKMQIGGPFVTARLVRLLSDEEASVAEHAVYAIAATGDLTAIPYLEAAAGHRESCVQRAAVEALGGMGPCATTALVRIRDTPQRPDKGDEIRDAASAALERVSLDAKAVCPVRREFRPFLRAYRFHRAKLQSRRCLYVRCRR